MRFVWLIGRRDFSQQVRSRGFLLATFGTPFFVMAIWLFSGAFDGSYRSGSSLADLTKAGRPSQPIGYVDQISLIKNLPLEVPAGLFRAFPNEGAASKALLAEEIEAFYVIPQRYLSTGELTRYSARLPLAPTERQLFSWVLAVNLLPDRSPSEVARLVWPFEPKGLQFVALGEEGTNNTAPKSPGMAPMFLALLIMTPLFMSGGYLLQGLAQEKENRIMEILLSSVRPVHLLAGKLLGLGALTLFQFGNWIIISGLTMKATGRDPLTMMGSVNLSGNTLLLTAAYAIGGFVLYATLMAGLGALAPNVEASRMWSFLITLPMMIPVFLWTTLSSSPNGPLAIFLSIFPFSAPISMLMRIMTADVPFWEVSLSLILMGLTAVGLVQVIAKMFKARTLLSGQPLSLNRFWEAARGA